MTQHENAMPGDAPAQRGDAGRTGLDTARLRELAGMLRDAVGSGAVSPGRARSAADAVEQVLLDAARRCPPPEPARRDIDELTGEEIGRLRLLNWKLVEAEVWIRQRRDQCLADYYRAGGVGGHGKHCFSDTLWEDVEIEAEVACVLREDHPDFDRDDDNIVVELSWDSFDGIVADPVSHNWNVFQFQPGHPFAGDHHCRLFHELYDHRLHHDWDRMLGIGTVWIDVHLIQQRGMDW